MSKSNSSLYLMLLEIFNSRLNQHNIESRIMHQRSTDTSQRKQSGFTNINTLLELPKTAEMIEKL
jgi:hypothetical protein